ncbi:histidine phosphatase superfamily [Phaeosphaeriaceae sp. PMI808]|nr:histidine phosphatase superfamily [Phaeosphaeriaceae sp. PMI808]
MFSVFLLASPALAVPLFSSALQHKQTPIQSQDYSQGYSFDPLLHLPGTSPYFDAVGFGLEHKAPTGCNITAASYIPLTQKKVGTHLLDRYPNLVPNTTRILADKKSRTYDTATNFTKAFPHHDDIEVVRITENKNGSMESLIPHKSCANFSKQPGTKEQHNFIHMYGASVSARLSKFTPFNLTPKDIVGMQSICGYESAILGTPSPLCAVFTDNEWMAYEYHWDLKYAYMVGPLNPLSPYLGFPWLQTQAELFAHIDAHGRPGGAWPPSQRFFLSFTHREVPPFVAMALGLFNSSSSAAEEFPTDHINWTRAWRMADLIPFLGHVGMEKMVCDRTGGALDTAGDGKDSRGRNEFVRFIANTAPRPIPECQSGPGASCPFAEFRERIGEGARLHGDFHTVCDKKG